MLEHKGVTLIELLIAVAIIATLTAIALPSYQSYMLKAHRTQAITDMIKIQLELEQHYTQVGNYDSAILSAANCTICESDNDKYQFSVTATNSGYLIEATAQNTQLDDTQCLIDRKLSLNSAGIGMPTKCW